MQEAHGKPWKTNGRNWEESGRSGRQPGDKRGAESSHVKVRLVRTNCPVTQFTIGLVLSSHRCHIICGRVRLGFYPLQEGAIATFLGYRADAGRTLWERVAPDREADNYGPTYLVGSVGRFSHNSLFLEAEPERIVLFRAKTAPLFQQDPKPPVIQHFNRDEERRMGNCREGVHRWSLGSLVHHSQCLQSGVSCLATRVAERAWRTCSAAAYLRWSRPHLRETPQKRVLIAQ